MDLDRQRFTHLAQILLSHILQLEQQFKLFPGDRFFNEYRAACLSVKPDSIRGLVDVFWVSTPRSLVEAGYLQGMFNNTLSEDILLAESAFKRLGRLKLPSWFGELSVAV